MPRFCDYYCCYTKKAIVPLLLVTTYYSTTTYYVLLRGVTWGGTTVHGAYGTAEAGYAYGMRTRREYSARSPGVKLPCASGT